MNTKQTNTSLYQRANFFDDKIALVFGVCVFLFTLFIGYTITHFIYNQADTLQLVTSLKSSALYLGGAMATGSITVMALMLSALGITRNLEAKFDKEIYLKIFRITINASALLGSSVVLLLLLCLPIKEINGIPQYWYNIYFWIALGLVALTSGLMIMTMVQLFITIKHMIKRVLSTI